MTTTLHTLSLRHTRALLITTAFVVGGLMLPQLCHLLPQGGLILLPIYFFTLIAAYKYGYQVGLTTAIATPIANTLLFGMPLPAVLPFILIKSALLALCAAYIAQRFKRVSLLLLFGVVFAYQLLGSLIESILIGSFANGFQDFRIGLPGLLLHIFCGYFLLTLNDLRR